MTMRRRSWWLAAAAVCLYLGCVGLTLAEARGHAHRADTSLDAKPTTKSDDPKHNGGGDGTGGKKPLSGGGSEDYTDPKAAMVAAEKAAIEKARVAENQAQGAHATNHHAAPAAAAAAAADVTPAAILQKIQAAEAVLTSAAWLQQLKAVPHLNLMAFGWDKAHKKPLVTFSYKTGHAPKTCPSFALNHRNQFECHVVAEAPRPKTQMITDQTNTVAPGNVVSARAPVPGQANRVFDMSVGICLRHSTDPPNLGSGGISTVHGLVSVNTPLTANRGKVAAGVHTRSEDWDLLEFNSPQCACAPIPPSSSRPAIPGTARWNSFSAFEADMAGRLQADSVVENLPVFSVGKNNPNRRGTINLRRIWEFDSNELITGHGVIVVHYANGAAPTPGDSGGPLYSGDFHLGIVSTALITGARNFALITSVWKYASSVPGFAFC